MHRCPDMIRRKTRSHRCQQATRYAVVHSWQR